MRKDLQNFCIPRTTCAHRSVYASVIIKRMAWTDERLKHQFDSIDRRFEEVDKRFEEVDKRFEEVDKRFDRVDAELGRVNDRLDGLHRILLQTNAVIIAALIGLIATQL